MVLPRLVTTYERHLGWSSPMTDAPVARALRLVLNDEIEDWQAGERLVERWSAAPTTWRPSTSFLQRLEAAVVGAGRPRGWWLFRARYPGTDRPERGPRAANRLKGLTRPVNFESSNRCARKRQT